MSPPLPLDPRRLQLLSEAELSDLMNAGLDLHRLLLSTPGATLGELSDLQVALGRVYAESLRRRAAELGRARAWFLARRGVGDG